MVFRAIGHDDIKGISDKLVEKHTIETDFHFYFNDDLTKMFDSKLSANSKLNEPIMIYGRSIENTFEGAYKTSSLMETIFNHSKSHNQLSDMFGEVDVVEVKFMKHNLINNISDYELDIVLRNRFDNYVTINPQKFKGDNVSQSNMFRTSQDLSPGNASTTSAQHSHSHESASISSECMFKNEFIDVLKLQGERAYDIKMDENIQFLKDDRYALADLESQLSLNPNKTQPAKFAGLEPYEMAQFKVLPCSVLKNIEKAYKDLATSVKTRK